MIYSKNSVLNDPGWFIHHLEGRICFLAHGCITFNFLYLSFSTLYSSALWRTDTIIFAKLNKSPLSNNPPPPSPSGFEINKWGLNRKFTVLSLIQDTYKQDKSCYRLLLKLTGTLIAQTQQKGLTS